MNSLPLIGLLASVAAACFLPRLWVIALALSFAFMPFLRTEVPIGAVPIGVRPEDIMWLILLGRTRAKEPEWLRGCSTDCKAFLRPYGVLIILVLVYTIYSIIYYPPSSVSFYFLQKALGSTAMILVCLMNLTSWNRIRIGMAAILIGGTVLCVVISSSNDTSYDVRPESGHQFDAEMYNIKNHSRALLVEWNPNSIGLALGGCVFVAASLGTTCRRRVVKAFVLGAAGMFAVFTVTSYTRTAILGLGGSVLYTAVRRHGTRQTRGIALVAIALCGVTYSTLARDPFNMDVGNDVNTGQRGAIWSAAVAAIMAQPMGYGAGAAELGMEEQTGKRWSAHNDWLDFALNLGVGGLVLTIYTFLSLAKLFRASSTKERSHRASAIIIEAFYAYLLICSFGLQVLLFTKQVFTILSVVIAASSLRTVTRQSLGPQYHSSLKWCAQHAHCSCYLPACEERPLL